MTVASYLGAALDGQRSGSVLPFVTLFRESGMVVGSARFWKMDAKNRKLEIGSTWISRSWQKTFVNTEAKYLMLRHAFEELACVRVQFTTDETKQKSHDTILRLGAKQEGVARNERIMPDGRKRNSVRFNIDDEWIEVRRRLEERLTIPRGIRSRAGPDASAPRSRARPRRQTRSRAQRATAALARQ